MKRGFTLIEVLIASCILVVVVAAIVALSNSINRNTLIASDMSDANNVAISDFSSIESAVQTNFSAGSMWLSQAAAITNYGWYYKDANTGVLTQFTDTKKNELTSSEVFAMTGEGLKNVNGVDYYKLICYEGFGSSASSLSGRQSDGSTKFYCNTNDRTTNYNDGTRIIGTDCEDTLSAKDEFCKFSKESLNKSKPTGGTDWDSTIIPSGNTLKVRSVVVWMHKEEVFYTDVAKIFTNQNLSTQ